MKKDLFDMPQQVLTAMLDELVKKTSTQDMWKLICQLISTKKQRKILFATEDITPAAADIMQALMVKTALGLLEYNNLDFELYQAEIARSDMEKLTPDELQDIMKLIKGTFQQEGHA